jgi:hypothetical protein
MPTVLTTNATVSCGPAPTHGGTAQLTSGSKLKVSGTPVLLLSGIGAISGCKQSSSNTSPDLALGPAPPPSGFSQKLMSDGSPVVLSTFAAVGSGKPPGNVSATESQTKLTAS